MSAGIAPDPQTGDPDQLLRAVELLRAGKLVAFPTETVYGLGADASNAHAVARIFAAKNRPADHPLIVHLPDASAIDAWAQSIPAVARKLAAAFWPGPLTMILNRQPHVLDAVTGGQDTVGLRVPGHPLALSLLRVFQGGIAAPSANRYGRISPTTAAHVHAELGATVPLVLDGGACTVGIESTIVDLSRGAMRILRPGAITAIDIANVLGTDPMKPSGYASHAGRATEDPPRVSGSHAAHYAPLTQTHLVAGNQLANIIGKAIAAGQRVAVLAHTATPITAPTLVWRVASPAAAQYAHDLYASLRDLDSASCDLLVIEAPPRSPEWLAVADRLQRAAFGSGNTDES